MAKTPDLVLTLDTDDISVVDWDKDISSFSITTNKVYTFANVPTIKTIMVIIKNETGGDLTVDFPAGIKWQEATPIVDVVAGTTSIFTFIKADDVIYVSSVDGLA